MKKLFRILIALILVTASATAETKMFCVNVGKGDAILIMTDTYTCLIDTGKKDAQENIQAALDRYGIGELDAIFITHTDNDHVGGLKWLKKFPVKAIYASKYYTGVKAEKHPAVKAVKKADIEVQWIGAGDVIDIGGGTALRVLAPATLSEDNEDDNSLVMMLDGPDGRILLAGDMEFAETDQLIDSGADLKCDVLKVPNHGDVDACPYALVTACDAPIAVISTSTAEKPDTPYIGVLYDLESNGAEIFVTQDCVCGVLVTMDKGNVRAEYVNEW